MPRLRNLKELDLARKLGSVKCNLLQKIQDGHHILSLQINSFCCFLENKTKIENMLLWAIDFIMKMRSLEKIKIISAIIVNYKMYYKKIEKYMYKFEIKTVNR